MQEDVSQTAVSKENASTETQSINKKAYELSAADIRRNMICCILLDAIYVTGWTDYQLALQPFLVWLGASNFIIGVINGAQWMALPGMILSPFITRHFRFKKWYMISAHVPYLLPLGLAGLFVVYGNHLGLVNKPQLLHMVLWLSLASVFFGGFVSLPHQEYVAAVIPMSHRGRFAGYSQGVGGVAGIGASIVGGIILRRMPQPISFGWVMFVSYAIIQMGYLVAIFAREKPTPVEMSPQPWSKSMLNTVLKDKLFMKIVGLGFLGNLAFFPTLVFVNTYGFRDLHMIPATSATIQMIGQITRIIGSAIIGLLVDRFAPRKALPYIMLFGGLCLLPVVILKNSMGVYVVAGLGQLFCVGFWASMNALIYGIPRPENRAGCYTVQIMITQMGSALGPLLLGFSCDHLNYISVFSGVIIASFAAFVIAKLVCSELPADLNGYS